MSRYGDELSQAERLDWHVNHSRHTPAEGTPQDVRSDVESLAEAIVAALADPPHYAEVMRMRATAGMRHKDIGAYLWPELHPHRATEKSMRSYSHAKARIRQLVVGRSEEEIRRALSKAARTRVQRTQEDLKRNLPDEVAPLMDAIFARLAAQ